MDKADLIGGAGLALLGFLMIFVIIPASTEEGMYFGLSPTFFPTLLTVLLTACALGLVAQSLLRMRRRVASRPFPLTSWNFLMFLASACLAFGGILAIDWFGMLVGGPILIGALMLFLGERNPLRIALTATVPVGLVYLLAIHVLGTPVP
ncbi:tripartite tricarboxylate transporter TctB family protein [Microbaculum marinum]|uniref:Tripartite tricarboxylate transporter TctB family protein n=1 Tax=Microbaculum marinum TaxID=1764581 RepID=A0AAW9RT02_9HYPH